MPFPCGLGIWHTNHLESSHPTALIRNRAQTPAPDPAGLGDQGQERSDETERRAKCDTSKRKILHAAYSPVNFTLEGTAERITSRVPVSQMLSTDCPVEFADELTPGTGTRMEIDASIARVFYFFCGRLRLRYINPRLSRPKLSPAKMDSSGNPGIGGGLGGSAVVTKYSTVRVVVVYDVRV